MGYQRILVAVDNSEHSNRAVDRAVAIARRFGARLVGAHVYAARLHDKRFVDLEPSLPPEMKDPRRLEASRRTHDSLIGKGLKMISDAYLDAVEQKCRAAGVEFERRVPEGRNAVELVREINGGGYDLAVFGSRGIAAMNGFPDVAGVVGSVTLRVVRQIRIDALVVRGDPDGPVVVGVDGGATSYEAVHRALNVARKLERELEIVAAFDPDFHPAAFKTIAGVLSEEAGRVFRFKEQQSLHDRVIDRGLEHLYRGYLENAAHLAKAKGLVAPAILLKGYPAAEIVRHARKASLIVLGRTGAHRTPDLDLGGTAENVLRLASCNVLLTAEAEAAALRWQPEAEARLERVPPFVRDMVRRAVEGHARARGLEEVTPAVVEEAKGTHGVNLPGH